MVLFPAPLSPIRATVSPAFMVKDTPLKISVLLYEGQFFNFFCSTFRYSWGIYDLQFQIIRIIEICGIITIPILWTIDWGIFYSYFRYIL